LLLSSSYLNSQERLLNRIILAYDRGDFRNVIEIANDGLKDTLTYTVDEEVKIRTYLAFSYVAIGEEGEASLQFEEILNLNPQYDLNPEFVSPKIVSVFKKVKMRRESIYLNLPDVRLIDVTFRTVLLPGWGHHYQGEKRKGKVLMYSYTVSAIGLAVSHIIAIRANDPHIDGTESFFLNSTLIIWGYSFIDILFAHIIEK